MKILRRIILLVLLTAAFFNAHGSEEDRVFFVYDASNGLADNSAQIVMSTKTGRIMVTTLGHVNFFDGAGFTHVDPLPSNIFPLPGYNGRYQLYFDRFHHLWIKNDQQMACVNLTTETFFRDIPALYKEMGVKGTVDDIFGDGVSQVWFQTGRQIYSPGAKKTFQIHTTSKLMDVDVYNDSLLFMFHADGSVVVNDYHSRRMMHQDHAFLEAERARYSQSSEICLVGHRYYQLHNGNNEAVLMRYDINTHEWKRLMETPFHMNAIYPWGDLLYIGTQRGYIVYNIVTDEYQHCETLTLSKGRSQVANINSLCFDRQGGLWIGTQQRGLLYCKAYRSPFKNYRQDSSEGQHYKALLDQHTVSDVKLPHKINCIFTDSRGWKWTGSYNGLELRRPDGTTQIFGRKDGMTNDVIHAVVEDQQHDIWASTSFGICHLFIRDGEVYHVEPYINQDNVPNDMFVNGRALSLPDGLVVMESLDYICTFRPSEFHAQEFGNIAINPKLIRLSVNGNDIEAGEELDGHVIIEKAVSRSAEINVSYNQNSLSMLFSGLNYLRPLQTYYRVRVKGVPAYNDWRILSYGRSDGLVDKSGQLHLSLLGLDAGDYQVELQTSMWPEIWTQEPYIWTIHVNQPWWRSTGIYITLGILVLVFLVLNFLMYNRNIQLRMLINNEEYDILRHIRTFANRCKNTPTDSAQQNSDSTSWQQPVNEDFVSAMELIVPYVNEHQDDMLSLDELADVAHMEKTQLYELLSSNIDKSPRLYLAALKKRNEK